MNFTENWVNQIMDDLHNGNFNEHRALDCAITAINDQKAHEKLRWKIQKMQDGYASGNYSDMEEVQHMHSLGEIAAKHYVRKFPTYGKWCDLMDVTTRCACGKRIWELMKQD